MNKSAFTIAVSGPSGSGKSTLTKQLRDKLVDAISFHFDDYASTNTYPDDFVEWLEKGADPKLVQNPDFNRDLSELVQGRSITLPNNQMVKSEKYIIVEEPFGRGREGMAELIDFVVCIDIPLEVALARRILRGIQNAECTPSETLKSFEEYLSQYLIVVRNLYQAINLNVMADCDLIVSGLEPIDVITDKIIIELEKRSII
ncbi:Uridine kinase [Paenibacillus sp. cl141a]|uniref:AAA family ATPase n=1 Tax=Paenibacillus sp. cl141a TaxID=1761877 RepID=UPI0008C120F0|nr:AAA family ATPase [Paenibacillus sp. cl141a]SEM04256.1 Uridine kinase [Paenibacillus sp. cl141a]